MEMEVGMVEVVVMEGGRGKVVVMVVEWVEVMVMEEGKGGGDGD